MVSQNVYFLTNHSFLTGDVIINTTYRLTHENALELSFMATTTKPTPINLSSHCYFNLGKFNHNYYFVKRHPKHI